MVHGAYDSFTAVMDVHIPDDHLADFSPVTIQRFHLRSESSQKFVCPIYVGLNHFWRLIGARCP